jgi:hypothetical protein
VRKEALYLGLCAATVGFALAFALPAFTQIPLLWYYPLATDGPSRSDRRAWQWIGMAARCRRWPGVVPRQSRFQAGINRSERFQHMAAGRMAVSRRPGHDFEPNQ